MSRRLSMRCFFDGVGRTDADSLRAVGHSSRGVRSRGPGFGDRGKLWLTIWGIARLVFLLSSVFSSNDCAQCRVVPNRFECCSRGAHLGVASTAGLLRDRDESPGRNSEHERRDRAPVRAHLLVRKKGGAPRRWTISATRSLGL